MDIHTILNELNKIDALYTIVYKGKTYQVYNLDEAITTFADTPFSGIKTEQDKPKRKVTRQKKDSKEITIGSRTTNKGLGFGKNPGYRLNKHRWEHLRNDTIDRLLKLKIEQIEEFITPEGESVEAFRIFICNTAREVLGKAGLYYNTTKDGRSIYLVRRDPTAKKT